jgi:predicted metal-binding protein
MKNVAIYVCGIVSKTCTANGCLRAFNQKQDSFERYEEDGCQLVSFNHCNGCNEDPMESLNVKIEKFQKANVDAVHLSSCIRGRCDHYEEFIKELDKHFDVVGYSHGSAQKKEKKTMSMSIDLNKGIIKI